MIFSNLWLFEKLLVKLLPSISAAAGAMTRTTLAFTTAKGSGGYNVLPQEAYVTGNMRFIPHQDADESIRIISEFAKKYDIESEVIYYAFPSFCLLAFLLLCLTVKGTFKKPETAPAAIIEINN